MLTKKGRQKYIASIVSQLSQKIAGPHYLNADYKEHKLTVFCFDSEKNISIASAHVTHQEMQRNSETHIVDNKKNNYVNFLLKPNHMNGFQVELIPVPDLMKKYKKLNISLDKVFKTMDKFPGENPFTKEHLKPVQH
jgi:hypothetical protein